MKDFKVLLVDDEEDFVKSLSERIGMRNLGSEVALDGVEALKKIQEQSPDVIVLDLKMPGMHGLEVLEKVKKAYPAIQVVILTGHGSEEDEKKARKLGAFDYLNKPVGLEKLMETITKAYKYKKKLEASMMASTFAEAGEFETAKEIMKKEDEGR